MEKLQYNTQRKRLPMPEYGRSIQNMVDYAITLEDREMRQRSAEAIIQLMGNMFPQWRDVPDFTHKLWDHLALMSDYRLDIDYPVEIVRAEKAQEKPERLSYGKEPFHYRHYGRILEKYIQALASYPQGEERMALERLVVIQMKRCLLEWNPSIASDARIAAHLSELTDGAVQITPEQVAAYCADIRDLLPQNAPASLQKNGGKLQKKKKKK